MPFSGGARHGDGNTGRFTGCNVAMCRSRKIVNDCRVVKYINETGTDVGTVVLYGARIHFFVAISTDPQSLPRRSLHFPCCNWYVWLTMMPTRQDRRNVRARGTHRCTTAGRERQGFANAKTVTNIRATTFGRSAKHD